MRYQSFCLRSISRLTGMELLYCQVESMFVSHVNGSDLTKHVINRPGFLLTEQDSLTFRNLTVPKTQNVNSQRNDPSNVHNMLK